MIVSAVAEPHLLGEASLRTIGALAGVLLIGSLGQLLVIMVADGAVLLAVATALGLVVGALNGFLVGVLRLNALIAAGAWARPLRRRWSARTHTST